MALYCPFRFLVLGGADQERRQCWPGFSVRLVGFAEGSRHTCRKTDCGENDHPNRHFPSLAGWVLLPQPRPATYRIAIPFEPTSALDRNQVAAGPFHGHEWRRSRHIPNCCCVYGSRPLPDCQHFPWSSALLPRSQCFVWSSAGFQRLARGSAELKRFAWGSICGIRGKAATDSDGRRPAIPIESGHPIRTKAATLLIG